MNMFQHFDPKLLLDPDFKEDAVREVIIAPILSRLGYHPIGEHTVIRSKTLDHPFVYVGTRKHPVKIIPDYTLYSNGKPVLILDAKSPTESIASRANVQQAYSYAIHPEIKVGHFSLCNGKRLAIYSTNNLEPLLDVSFEEYEQRWEDIEKFFLPKYLLQPGLRMMAPDFGLAASRLGLEKNAQFILMGAHLGMFAKVSEELYSVTVNTEFCGKDHCVSFDFEPKYLPSLVSGLPIELQNEFCNALSRAPFQAGADLCIEVDLKTHLCEPIKAQHETFVPLIIDEVIASRFNSSPPAGGDDIPPNIFRLSKAFIIKDKEEEST